LEPAGLEGEIDKDGLADCEGAPLGLSEINGCDDPDGALLGEDEPVSPPANMGLELSARVLLGANDAVGLDDTDGTALGLIDPTTGEVLGVSEFAEPLGRAEADGIELGLCDAATRIVGFAESPPILVGILDVEGIEDCDGARLGLVSSRLPDGDKEVDGIVEPERLELGDSDIAPLAPLGCEELDGIADNDGEELGPEAASIVMLGLDDSEGRKLGTSLPLVDDGMLDVDGLLDSEGDILGATLSPTWFAHVTGGFCERVHMPVSMNS